MCLGESAGVIASSTEAGGHFSCAACGRRYKWKPALAGRSATCACGRSIAVPLNSTTPDDELYDVSETPRPSAPSPSPAVVPPAHGPLAYQSRRSAKDEPDAYFPDKTIDFHLPLALLAAGVIIEVAAALLSARSRLGLGATLQPLGMHLILGTATMLIGVLIAARFRGIDLGKLPVALLKLAAICVAPGAAVTLLGPALRVIPFGFLIGLAGQFILYFALLGTLFKLDESDTWYCVCVIFIINVAVYFALLQL